MYQKDVSRFYLSHMETVQKSLAMNIESISDAAELIVRSLRNGQKLLICGNGGSAADAQHIAAEFIGRYKRERRSLPAIALTVDTSAITAIGNDHSFDDIFARQLEGLGNAGDILLVLSTSGNSGNCIRAVEQARKMGIKAIGLLGKNGGKLAPSVDIPIIVPSDDTPRIQECHMLIYHAICEVADEAFSENDTNLS